MKKLDFKIRLQWNWYKAAFFGIALVILLVPAAGSGADDATLLERLQENPVVEAVSSISFGPKYKILLNGEVVALAKKEEDARQAYENARLAYNAEGVRILKVNMTIEEADKEKDATVFKKFRPLKGEKLKMAILESFDTFSEEKKELAYTMRIDDYTVTVSDMSEVISVLEKAQGKYDTEDRFKVGLSQPSSRNVTMYEVKVEEKQEASSEAEATQQTSEETISTESTEEQPSETVTEAGVQASLILPVDVMRMTGAEAGEEGIEQSTEETMEEGEPASEETEAVPAEAGEADTEQSAEETTSVEEKVAAQAVNDGVKFVGFSEVIQVMETYVAKEQITDKKTAYAELTAENDTEAIYVVQPGDCLSVIAEKNNMSVEQIKELNSDIESDDDIYYDDRLNVTVPEAAVQILIEKQETYEEEYYEDTVYQDDDSMYIGESEVVQEGISGRHIVTDLVTYKGDLEAGREEVQETIEVAAVAQVVRRGTKSKPTYMYPVTNWNVTSNFGYRWGRLHAGTDVGIPIGTTVRASRGGQVVTAGWVGGYGNCVIIDHGDGVCTRYGHLSQVLVTVGQYVDQGEQIALSGNTGRSTGPHLHFEIRINGEAVDPMPYLTQTQ